MMILIIFESLYIERISLMILKKDVV